MDLLKDDVPVRVIESESDYELALEQMAALMANDPPTGSDSERLLKTLVVLVRDYESHRYPIAPPGPIEAIKFRMEQTPDIFLQVSHRKSKVIDRGTRWAD